MSPSAVERTGLPGREGDLEALTQALDRALAGAGGICALVGEAGMGKSRLAREVAEAARERGYRVAVGQCWETVDAPALWPWLQILEQISYSAPDTQRPVAAAAADLQQRTLSLTSASSEEAAMARVSIMQSISSTLGDSAADQPLLIVLEDLHAADETSLLVLRFVATTLRVTRALILATYDEVATSGSPAIFRLLHEITRTSNRIDLAPLDRSAVEQIYARLTGGVAPDATVDALMRSTEGNPLFVEESIRLLMAEGDLHRPDHSVGFRVPSGVRDILSARLALLPDPTREVLSAASVVGTRFESRTLAAALKVATDDVLQLLEPALGMRLVTEAGALGEFGFKHVLIRETLYEGLRVSQRMKLHREVADALEAEYGSADDLRLSELAHHWFKAAQAGDAHKAAGYTIRAADQAAARGAPEEAARLYQRGLKILEKLPKEQRRRQEIERKLRDLSHAPTNADASPAESDGNIFRKEGDYWTIKFGDEVFRLKDSKGLRLIGTLVANPGRELHALDLATTAGTREMPATAHGDLFVDSAGADPVLDEKAKQALRRRIRELESEIDESQRFNDPARAERARDELDELRAAIASAVGLGGRNRELGSVAERARISVTKTIKDALKKIGSAAPALGSHLSATIKTGMFCSYNPDPRVPIMWQT